MRPGAAEAVVEGRFELDGGEVVLARVVPADGRSRAYVDGRLATVATLAEAGASLVDLHGQHAHQSLLAAAAQRQSLDRFAGIDLGPLRAARQRIADLDAALAALGGDARARAREIDLLRYQVEELERAGIGDPDEEAQLERRRTCSPMPSPTARRRRGAVGDLVDDGGALDGVRAALAAIQTRGAFTDAAERLRAAAAELDDLAASLRDQGEAIEDDPARLAWLGERRHTLRELRRKYGDTLAEVIAYGAEAQDRLAELEGYEGRAAVLEAERAAAVADEAAAAAAVGAARRQAAPRLAAAVADHLRGLAMAKARVDVTVGAVDPGDDVTFLLGANPGEPALPLAKVASGGELARTMLALRLVLTEAPDSLVFDEVDAGVGGEAALAVGRALATLGRRHQVLVVTHLPQVAVAADAQIAVSKATVAGRTEASALAVTGEDRVRELSRMLSGLSDSASARQHAEELLAEAAERRRRLMAVREHELDEVVGRVRVDRRTKLLLQRVQPGEIAVIDHEDLDRIAAEGLVAAGVLAVVNASASFTGRYPNVGPLVVVAAGIPLVDDVGPEVMELLRDGEVVAITGDEVRLGDDVVAVGRRPSVAELEAGVERARSSLGAALERFATNTLEHLKRERHLAMDAPDMPEVGMEIHDRQVLVVVRGQDHREDLVALKRSGYLRERKPVLIGVDGGADALLELGLKPHIIIGDFDSVSEQALRSGAKLVVHAYPGGQAPGAARLEGLGLDYVVFEAPGTSEDIALLLAYEKGAELIVAVGTHTSMEEFLDKGREGMASTFLVRLRVGRVLVDAKGVSRLYRPTVRTLDVTLLVLAMVIALGAVLLVSPPVQLWLKSLWLLLRSAVGQ